MKILVVGDKIEIETVTVIKVTALIETDPTNQLGE
jgi:hypothetical protein